MLRPLRDCVRCVPNRLHRLQFFSSADELNLEMQIRIREQTDAAMVSGRITDYSYHIVLCCGLWLFVVGVVLLYNHQRHIFIQIGLFLFASGDQKY